LEALGGSWGLTLNTEYARIKQVDIKVILPVHEKILAKQSISPFTKKSQIFLSRYFKQFADFTLFHSFY